ncbi:MAG TPA: DoxX family protein [Candidatus Methylacidiphilales bacterium]|nr:DoxX family protein [Candidatus Methylacidiphilales bacterium]
MSIINRLYGSLVQAGNHLQSPFLLIIRLIWGSELFQAGSGKLFHIDKPIGYFTQLGIPFPVENAYLVACTETFGGVLLALGLCSRLTAIPLIINFIVAYITTEQEALKNLLHFDFDDFIGALPFTYLLAAIIALVFGPGVYSVDYLINRWLKMEWKGPGV